MTVTWLALAALLLLVPVPSPAAVRARALTGHGVPGRRGASGPPSTPWWRRVDAAYLLPVALALVGGLGVLAVAVARGPLLGAACGIAVATLLCLSRASAATRRLTGDRAALLAALRLLVAELESGARPASALTAAAGACSGPLGPHRYAASFTAAAGAATAGQDVSDALPGDGELAELGHAWRVAERTGAPLAGVLDGVAGDLAERIESGRAVAAAVAGPRSSAGLLAVLPLLGLALGTAMGARPWVFLTDSAAGQATCCLGTLLDAAGVLWTQRLVHNATGPDRRPRPGRP